MVNCPEFIMTCTEFHCGFCGHARPRSGHGEVRDCEGFPISSRAKTNDLTPGGSAQDLTAG